MTGSYLWSTFPGWAAYPSIPSKILYRGGKTCEAAHSRQKRSSSPGDNDMGTRARRTRSGMRASGVVGLGAHRKMAAVAAAASLMCTKPHTPFVIADNRNLLLAGLLIQVAFSVRGAWAVE